MISMLLLGIALGGVLTGAGFVAVLRRGGSNVRPEDIDRLLDMAEISPATNIRRANLLQKPGVVVLVERLKIVMGKTVQLEYADGLLYGVTVAQRQRACSIGMSKIIERLDQHATRYLLGPAGEENKE